MPTSQEMNGYVDNSILSTKHSLVVNGVEMECWGGYEHNKPETHGNIKLRREKLGFK